MKKPFIKRILPFFKARFAPRGARLTFSQYGEDLIMYDILKKQGVKSISYIDIGAHQPIFGNNTYLFYKNGGQGVLVEPNKDLCKLIKNKRPRDICLNAGAGKNDEEANFYQFTQSTRSTFSKIQAEEHQENSGQIAKIEKQKIFSLDSILNEYFKNSIPDVVSIDAEGLDIEILSGFSWKCKPKIFCIESMDGDSSLMEKQGYNLVAKILQNLIFVLK